MHDALIVLVFIGPRVLEIEVRAVNVGETQWNRVGQSVAQKGRGNRFTDGEWAAAAVEAIVKSVVQRFSQLGIGFLSQLSQVDARDVSCLQD